MINAQRPQGAMKTLELVAEANVPAAAEQVVGHRVGIAVCPALDVGRTLVEQVIDAQRYRHCLVERILHTGVVVDDAGCARGFVALMTWLPGRVDCDAHRIND